MRAFVLLPIVSLVACSGSDPADPGRPPSDSSVSSETSGDAATVDSTGPDTSAEVSTDASFDVLSDSESDALGDSLSAMEAGASCEPSCGTDEICTFPDGSCGKGTGTCTKKPTKGDCSGMGSDPVCGCDGKDYGNHCYAAVAGQSVAKVGSCTCGDGTCDASMKEDCSTCPADCGSCVGCGDGVCAKDTEDCTSCPGDCCTTTTCTLSTKCLGDMYCAFVPGTCGTSGSGTCDTAPATCPAPTAGSTVCGCDGTSYASDCVAAQSGVSVKHAGLCP